MPPLTVTSPPVTSFIVALPPLTSIAPSTSVFAPVLPTKVPPEIIISFVIPPWVTLPF